MSGEVVVPAATQPQHTAPVKNNTAH